MTLCDFLAVGAAAVCACTDVRTARVSNRFLLGVLCAGAALRVISAAGIAEGITGIRGAADMAAGAALPFLTMFPLFLFRMIGAGDIKLLMLTGFLLGRERGIKCIIWSFVIGAVFSAGLMISRRNTEERFFYLITYIRQSIRSGRRMPYRTGREEDAQIHFAVPVLMAAILITGGII